ncbi:PREDICTED: cell division cycle 7-related protein kinase-like [Priapulus caudatus]|uniref:non-specific serine/threonine protein kinase n=1 Tax=Priapulus caudatus TaxID=37621 RepID=A0ABM1EJR0_PRICU|nr:PREDICTED: cell division cycle 7-related protein kinase-like [Priapulus caudatus]
MLFRQDRDAFQHPTTQDRKGTFSCVYLAIGKPPHGSSKFAVKHVVPTSHPRRIENELQCMTDLGGVSNVIKVETCLRRRDHTVIVMPYFPHEKFQDYMLDMTVCEVTEYMRNLLLALRHVHAAGIIHRDLKPSNFLYSRNTKEYALVDFGLAQKPDVTDDSSSMKPVTRSRSFSLGSKVLQAVKKQLPKARSGSTGGAAASSDSKRTPDESLVNTSSQSVVKKRRTSEESSGVHSLTSGHENKAAMDALLAVGKTKATHAAGGRVAAVDTAAFFFAKSYQSPRRTLLARRAIMSMGGRHGSASTSTCKTQQTVRDVKKKYAIKDCSVRIHMTCACHGKPKVCRVCLARKSQFAPRAGTPGFRPPEVLLKHPLQTTVCGNHIIMSSPALNAWSQIFVTDKTVLCSQRCPALDLRKLCERLRHGNDVAMETRRTRRDSARGSPCRQCRQVPCMCRNPGARMARTSAGSATCASPRRSSDVGGVGGATPRPARARGGDSWKEVPPSAYALLYQLLDLNPSTRITAAEAMESPFLTEGREPGCREK